MDWQKKFRFYVTIFSVKILVYMYLFIYLKKIMLKSVSNDDYKFIFVLEKD